jgi:hypothetical protein
MAVDSTINRLSLKSPNYILLCPRTQGECRVFSPKVEKMTTSAENEGNFCADVRAKGLISSYLWVCCKRRSKSGVGRDHFPWQQGKPGLLFVNSPESVARAIVSARQLGVRNIR